MPIRDMRTIQIRDTKGDFLEMAKAPCTENTMANGNGIKLKSITSQKS